MEYRGLTLDGFQVDAIQALKDGDSVLVAAPTGTGKTIIADWIVEEALRNGQEVIYTAPIKALSNQKFRDYVGLYGEENVGLVTGDLVIRRDAPCRVMTTEVLRNMLLSGDDVPDLRAVIIDEIHFLDDRDRGTVWEEVLIYLPQRVQIVGLSATLSNIVDFAAWLESVRQRRVRVIQETTRAVPLTFHFAAKETGLVDRINYEKVWKKRRHRLQPQNSGDRRQRGRDRNRGRRKRLPRKTFHTDIFEIVKEEDLFPYLYFVFSRKDTELCARRLSEYVGYNGSLLTEEERHLLDEQLDAAGDDLVNALTPELVKLYRKGIACHHAGMHVRLKALVEKLYEARLIKVLYCTSTFALGINMPARTVCFDGLKKFDGRGFNPLTTRGFMQKAGRAGRRGLDDVGHVIIRMDLHEWEEFKPVFARYEKQAVEPVRSQFNLSWNSVVSLMEAHVDPERIREVVDKSFLNWHLSKRAEGQQRQAEELLSTGAKGRKQAAKLRRKAKKSTSRCWELFQEKVGFLEHIGYLDEEGFNAGARVLCHLQMSEIFTTELLLDGVFEGLSPARTFGLLCALTNTLPRHARVNFRPKPEDRALAKWARRIRMGKVVSAAEEFTNEETVWDEALISLGRAWAEGEELTDIMMMVSASTDISGDLITGFRRAKDLAGQLREVFQESDPDKASMLRRLQKQVSRDEVQVVG